MSNSVINNNPVARALRIVTFFAMLLPLVGSPRLTAHAQDDSYQQIIDDSKSESDGLLIYSSLSDSTLAPLFAAFHKRYPWIEVTNVESTNYEVFNAYFDEIDQNTASADILISSDQTGWRDLIGERENLPYKSIEDKNLPAFAKDAEDGTYLFAANPTVLIWNKAAVNTPIKSIKELADQVSAAPTAWAKKISVFDATENITAFDLFWYYVQEKGDPAWALFDPLGKAGVTVENTSEKIVENVLNGTSNVGLFVEASAIAPYLKSDKLGWSPITDGMPIAEYTMSITQDASSPNSAKLFIDFALSAEGQTAIAEGGLPAYRDDLAGKSILHENQFFSGVADDQQIYFDTEKAPLTDEEAQTFIERWEKAFGVSADQ